MFYCLAFDTSGALCLAYSNIKRDWRISVLRYNGSSWDTIGNPLFTQSYFVYAINSVMDLGFDATDTPYLLVNASTCQGAGKVMKFDGGYWETVGDTSGFTDGPISSGRMFFNDSGRISVGSCHFYNLNTDSFEVNMVTNDTGSWELAGGLKPQYIYYDAPAIPFSGPINPLVDLVFDSSGSFYVAHCDLFNNGYIEVSKYAEGAWSLLGNTYYPKQCLDCVATGSLTVNRSGVPYLIIQQPAGVLPYVITLNPAGFSCPAICAGYTDTLHNAAAGGYWFSSNTSVAAVGSATGALTGIAAGTSVISYMTGSVCLASGTVTVVDSSGSLRAPWPLREGDFTLISSVLPGGVWTSSNSGIALPGQYPGSVYGMAPGTAIITYTFGGSCTSAITVSVIPEKVGMMTSVAGNNTHAESGDGGPAKLASVAPIDVKFDGHGNLFLADSSRIRKISGGIITTVAGVDSAGYLGDYGPATGAKIVATAIAVDTAGNVYLAGGDICRIRKVSTSGFITTIAGNGTPGYYGNGVPATTALIGYVGGLCTDKLGNLYFCDDHRIRKIDTANIITTVAGNGSFGYTGDGGPATAAEFGLAMGIAVDTSGAIFFVDRNNNVVRKVSASGIISTFAGGNGFFYDENGYPATSRSLGTVYGVATDNYGNVYVTTGGSYSPPSGNKIIRINSAGLICDLVNPFEVNPAMGTAYWGDCGPATAAGINNPTGITVDSTGNIFFADRSNFRVREILFNNHRPRFVNGDHANISVCEFGVDSLDQLLRAIDSDYLQSVSWSTVVAPVHGALNALAGKPTDADTLTPSGLFYAPAFGYSGPDSFKVVVSDCYSYDTMTVSVTVIPIGPIFGAGCIAASSTLTDTTAGGIWASGDISVAVVGSSSGVVTGVSVGTAVISYTVPLGCTATATVTIRPVLPVIGGPDSLCPGTAVTLTDSMTGGSWSSAALSIATVDSASGVVAGVAAGTAAISYRLGAGCLATRVVSVNELPPAIAGFANNCPGVSVTLSDGMSGGYWTTGDALVAAVGSASGVTTGVSAGNTTVSYTIAATGCSATISMTVNPLPDPIPPIPLLCPGTYAILEDSVFFGTWSSSDPSVAVLDSPDVLFGVSEGTAVVTYKLATGCEVTEAVTVNPLPAPISGPSVVCLQHYTFTDATPAGIWGSANPLVATANLTTGQVTGISNGSAVITYQLTTTGCMITKTVTVYAPSPIAGAATMCSGREDTLRDLVAGGSWTSGNTGIATVGSSTGIVSGIDSGVVTIRYTLPGGCGADFSIDVYPGPIASTGDTVLCAGTEGTLSNIYPGGEWLSSDTSVVTVVRTLGLMTAVAEGTAVISYVLPTGCFVTTPVLVVSSGFLIAGPDSLCAGTTAALAGPVTGGTWSTDDISVASVSGAGVVNGVAAGTAVISYEIGGGCRAAKVETVLGGPSAISGATPVCMGGTIALSDGTPGGTWSSGNAAVGTISAAGSFGGVAAGTVIISYTTASGCSIARAVTVNPLPAAINGPAMLCTGASAALSDTMIDGEWISNAPTVAAIGLFTGTIIGLTAGTAAITYTLPTGCRNSTVITVNSTPPAITGTGTVCVGDSTTLGNIDVGGVWSSAGPVVSTGPITGTVTGTSVGTAIITYTLSGCHTMTTVTVNANPAAIAGGHALCAGAAETLTDSAIGGVWMTAGAAAIGSASGHLTALAPGTSVVTYTLPGGCLATDTITVTTSPSAITGPGAICTAATVIYTDGVGGGAWSTASAVMTIDAVSGAATGITAGTAVISYSLGTSCLVTKTVTVTTSPSIISGSGALCLGATTALTDSITGGTWSTSAATVAAIGTGGIMTGAGTGTATITYRLPTGCYATLQATVNPEPAAISGPGQVCAGGAMPLTDATVGGVWISSNTGVAAVDSSGGITGIAAGTAHITYTLSGCTAGKTITVNPMPAAITGLAEVCTGDSATLSDATTGGHWGSGAAGIAAIGTLTGRAVGISVGTTIITYTLPTGCASTLSFTVNTTPASISGITHECAGDTAMLTDATPGGLWSSTGGAITIGSVSGRVTGNSAGAASITYALATGCRATATFTVNARPAAIAGADSLCQGAMAAMSDSTASGAWSATIAGLDTTGAFTGVVAGTGIISYTLPGGCYVTHNIDVLPLPAAIAGVPAYLCPGTTATLSDTAPGGLWSASGAVAIGSLSGIMTGIAEGSATVSYILTTGCYITATVAVSPGPGPISGPATVCAGAAVALTDATLGGDWSSGALGIATVDTTGMVTGVIAGTSEITYTVANLCGVFTAMHPVTVLPLPVAGVITGPDTLCIGATATLADTTGDAGAWYSSNSCATAAGSVITGVHPGSDAIIRVAVNSCGADTTYHSMIIDTLPVVAAIAGPSAVCVGAEVMLTDATAGGTWQSSGGVSVSGGVVSGVAAGTAEVSYTGSNRCGSSIVTHAVLVQALPVAGTITGDTMLCAGAIDAFSDTSTDGIWSSDRPLVAVIDAAGAVSAVQAGADTVRYTVTNGCGTAQAALGIAIKTTPVPAPITTYPDKGVCGGTMYQNFGADSLVAGINYTWGAANAQIYAVSANRASCIVSFSNPGLAVVWLTAVNAGCAAADSVSFQMGQESIPAPGVVYYQPELVCTDNTADSYQWGYDDVQTLDSATFPGAINQNYYCPDLDLASKYYWVLTMHNGCIQKSYYNAPLAAGGTEDQGLAIRLYPNPATGIVNIEVSGLRTTARVQVRLCDVLGVMVADSWLTGGKGSVSLAGYAAGVYMVTISQSGVVIGNASLVVIGE